MTESTRDGEELGVCGLRALVQRVGPSANAIHRALDVTSDDVTLVTVTRG